MSSRAPDPSLFPDVVSQFSLYFEDDVVERLPPGFQWPSALVSAVARRRREFAAGRYCAAQAIAAHAPNSSGVVGMAPDRSPVWPDELVGSITHTIDFASAAVAWRRQVRGLGIDTESIMSAEVATETESTITLPGELDALIAASARATPRATLLTLVFSAKEALYKCVRPLVGSYFDFLDAQLVEIGGTGRFTVELRRALTPEFAAGRLFEGRFVQSEAQVSCGVLL